MPGHRVRARAGRDRRQGGGSARADHQRGRCAGRARRAAHDSRLRRRRHWIISSRRVSGQEARNWAGGVAAVSAPTLAGSIAIPGWDRTRGRGFAVAYLSCNEDDPPAPGRLLAGYWPGGRPSAGWRTVWRSRTVTGYAVRPGRKGNRSCRGFTRRIAVVGTGYVGLTVGACLASLGHRVPCADVSEAKVERLRDGQINIREPCLAEMIAGTIPAGSRSWSGQRPRSTIGSARTR